MWLPGWQPNFSKPLEVTVTPGGSGVFKIAFDGEIVFDKANNDGKFPDLNGNVKALKKLLQEKVASVPVGAAD
jgi:predicted Rdx family selenoprotein